MTTKNVTVLQFLYFLSTGLNLIDEELEYIETIIFPFKKLRSRIKSSVKRHLACWRFEINKRNFIELIYSNKFELDI